MDGGDSQSSLYQILLDRFRNLETSHLKLKHQFDEQWSPAPAPAPATVGDGGEDGFASFYYGDFLRPHKSVLEYIGNAIYVSRPVSEEIIFWNRAAEKLYGYKDFEVVGKRYSELLIDEEHCAGKKFLSDLDEESCWSGQFPFKKRSGEIFMALVTKSPLYEDGELAGIVIVSSDAAPYNSMFSSTPRSSHDCGNGRPGLDLKKIKWHAQSKRAFVPQVASTVSNMASKVLSRIPSNDRRSICSNIREEDEIILEGNITSDKKPLQKVKARIGLRFGRSTAHADRSANDGSTIESSQPHKKFASKVLSKLNIGKLGKDRGEGSKDSSLTYISVRNGVTRVPYSPNLLNVQGLYNCVVGAYYEEKNEEYFPCAARTRCPRGDVRLNTPIDVEAFAKEYKVPEPIDLLVVPRFQVKDSDPDESGSQKPKCLELVGQTKQQSVPQQSHNSGETTCNSEKLSSREEIGLHANCEILWEDVQLREEIGQGSMAVVYRGIWNASDVAVKIYFGNDYSEEALLDSKKEIDIMRTLRHPNVLLFMGAIYSQNKIAMVTEFLPRGSLFKVLHKGKQSLDIKRRLRMALDVARGVNYLHNRKPPIVHRDLKTSNLLVDKNWNIKVGDFGLSKLKHATFLTAKSGRGTPQWMAPEVLRTERSNEKSDVYSFGVILWELMTGSVPWSDLIPLQVVGVVGYMDRRLDIPKHIDPRISSVIEECWRSNPEDRPSFKDLIKTINDVILTVKDV